MDLNYNFLLLTDTLIVLLIIGWFIFVYLVFKHLDGFKKKITLVLLTPLVLICGPHMLIDNKVQDITMYAYYKVSIITYKYDNQFTFDYYDHIDENGKPDAYARRIQDGMSKVDDNIANVGYEYGFGVPDKPEFEKLSDERPKKYWRLFWDSSRSLFMVPLIPFFLLLVLTLYKSIQHAYEHAYDYPNTYDYSQYNTYVDIENDLDNDKEELDYWTSSTPIEDTKQDLNLLNQQKEKVKKEIDELYLIKQKKEEEMDKEIEQKKFQMEEEFAQKKIQLDKLNKEIEEKIAQDEFFTS